MTAYSINVPGSPFPYRKRNGTMTSTPRRSVSR